LSEERVKYPEETSGAVLSKADFLALTPDKFETGWNEDYEDDEYQDPTSIALYKKYAAEQFTDGTELVFPSDPKSLKHKQGVAWTRYVIVDGKQIILHYNDKDHLHRIGGPAVIREFAKGTEYEYYKDDGKHRDGGLPAIISPNYVEWWKDGALHRATGPSTQFLDGFKLWTLNGVYLDTEEHKWGEHIVMTHSSKLTPKEALSIENAEIRREYIRKMGIDRFRSDTDVCTIVEVSKKMCEDGKTPMYELLDINFGEVEGSEYVGRHLLMVNPSVSDFSDPDNPKLIYHVEGVANECETVEAAIEWRNDGLKGEPVILT